MDLDPESNPDPHWRKGIETEEALQLIEVSVEEVQGTLYAHRCTSPTNEKYKYDVIFLLYFSLIFSVFILTVCRDVFSFS